MTFVARATVAHLDRGRELETFVTICVQQNESAPHPQQICLFIAPRHHQGWKLRGLTA